MLPASRPDRPARPGRAPLRRLLGVLLDEPDLRRIERASAISTTARWFYLIALLVLAYQLSGLAGLAALSLARTLPAGLAVPMAGVLGARVSGRRLLAGAYAGRAAAIGLGAIGGAAGLLWVLLLAAGIDAVLGTLRRPVQAALLPHLTRSPGDLVAANVSTARDEGLAGLVGPLAGAAALVLGDPVTVLACSAVGFALASVLAAGISVPGGATGAAVASAPGSLRAGLSALAVTPVPRLVTAGSLAAALAQGSLSVLLVPAATELLGLGEAGIGNLYAALGLGGVLAPIALARLIRPAALDRVMLASLALWGLPLVVIALVPLAPLAVGLLVVAGVAAALLETAGYGLLSRTLSRSSRAMGIAVFEGASEAAFGLGGVLAPVLVALFGERGAILAAGALVAAAPVLIWPLLRPWRASLAGRADVVAQLRRLPLFSPLPLAVLEELAADAQPHSFPAKTALMREGEPGDAFHVITTGRVSVAVGGDTVATLGPGQGVGEIALLRDTPRTATVLAIELTDTLAIDGPAFVAAVASQTGSLTAAAALAGGRLGEQVGLLDRRGAEARRSGRWDEAVAVHLRSRHARIGEGRTVEAALLADGAARILADQGRLTEAESLVREAQGQLGGADETAGALLEASLGMVLSRMGRHMVGLTALQHAAARLDGLGAADRCAMTRAATAECLLLAGLPRDAEDTARRTLEAIGQRQDLPVLKAELLRTLGWCALAGGQLEAARTRLTESLAAARAGGDSYQTALTLRALGRLPARAGGVSAARSAAEAEAAAILDRLGVVRVAEPPVQPSLTRR